MSAYRTKRVVAAGALLLSALAAGGCSISIADLPLAGTPADAPARAQETNPYLPVGELPPERDEATIAPAVRDKMKADLLAARDRQASATTTKSAKDDKDTKDAKDTTAK
jgi:hypothetical protein